MDLRSLLLALLALVLVGCPSGDDDDVGDDDDIEDPTPAGPPIDEDFAAELEQALGNAQEDYEPPGIQVAVQAPGRAVWTAASGSLSTTDTLKVGGIGQLFVAAALLQMEAEGVIPLANVVDLWVPGLSWGQNPTISQLLNYNSGVPDYIGHPDFAWTGTWQPEALAALASEFDPNFGPGSDFEWTHSNYVVASLALQEAAGQAWEAELSDRFLIPLELNNTRFPEVGAGWGGVAPGFIDGADVTDANDPSAYGAAANLVSKASDLARFGSELFGGELLSAEKRWDMYGHPFNVGNGLGYGLGVVATSMGGPGGVVQIGNVGEVDGYTAWLGYREDLDVTVVVIANAWTPSQGSNYSRWVANEIWSVVEHHVAPSGDDDDDDFEPLAEPVGQMRLHGQPIFDPIGEGAAPDHTGVRITGFWDFDNDGGTIGSVTVTSADFSSGEAVGAVDCEVTADGTYNPADRQYDITGTLSLESWGSSACEGWPGFESWHEILQFELTELQLVPIDRVPDNWGAQENINDWAAGAPSDATVPFVILTEFSTVLSAHPQTPPFGILGHFWQRPGDL